MEKCCEGIKIRAVLEQIHIGERTVFEETGSVKLELISMIIVRTII